MTTRRTVLKGLAAGGLVAGAGLALPSYLRTPFAPQASAAGAWSGDAQPLPIPPLETGRVENGVRIFDLALQRGRSRFLDGRETPTLGINGPYLGPTLKLRNGETVELRVANGIGEPTTIHWHGLHVPAIADGGPHQVIAPGATWLPRFEVKQKAGMFWYHPHLLHKTGLHAYLGMAGAIYVEDESTGAVALPATYGVDDLPIVLQDKRFGYDGALQYMSSMHDRMMGMKGDVLLVNGAVAPVFQARTERVRLRILNGSNARIYKLGFADNRPFHIVAGDGSLLPAPVSATRAVVSPGERIEIVVDMRGGGPAELVTFPYDSLAGMGMGGGMMGGGMGMMGGMGRRMMGMMSDDGRRFRVLRLEPAERPDPSPALPARLAALPRLDPARADRTRRFVMSMQMGPMMMFGGGGFTINGRTMDMKRIDERVKLGATEIWQIENDSPMAHPFHIHDIQFRILDRNGRPAGAAEAGLKDTVLVGPGERVRVIARFEDYADPENPYMYHCHILEHEDAGMMGQFVVEA